MHILDITGEAIIFLLVFIFFRFRVGWTKKKLSSGNDQLTGHFQSFLFFNISRPNSKTSKVNQQSVLNIS